MQAKLSIGERVVCLIVSVVVVGAGVCVGYFVLPSSNDAPCKSGEVYVIDTKQCVAGTDHEAHNGH